MVDSDKEINDEESIFVDHTEDAISLEVVMATKTLQKK